MLQVDVLDIHLKYIPL